MLQGLIFINFDADAVSFDPVEKDLGPLLAPWDLENAKIAHRQNYPIAANWKLDGRELLRVLSLPAGASRVLGRPRPRDPAQGLRSRSWRKCCARSEQVGLSRGVTRHSWLDAGPVGTDRDFERYPLLRGHLTGSRDGKPVAPLMGTSPATTAAPPTCTSAR